jgi:uncharacterized membrane protein YhaH (DUF805 family)
MLRFLSYIFSFGGRANRQHYWVVLVGALGIGWVHGFLLYGSVSFEPNPRIMDDLIERITLASFLIGLAQMIAIVSVIVRRLHDIGLSGWWLLAAAFIHGFLDMALGSPALLFAGGVPSVAGRIVTYLPWGLLVLLGAIKGGAGQNRFGDESPARIFTS